MNESKRTFPTDHENDSLVAQGAKVVLHCRWKSDYSNDRHSLGRTHLIKLTSDMPPRNDNIVACITVLFSAPSEPVPIQRTLSRSSYHRPKPTFSNTMLRMPITVVPLRIVSITVVDDNRIARSDCTAQIQIVIDQATSAHRVEYTHETPIHFFCRDGILAVIVHHEVRVLLPCQRSAARISCVIFLAGGPGISVAQGVLASAEWIDHTARCTISTGIMVMRITRADISGCSL